MSLDKHEQAEAVLDALLPGHCKHCRKNDRLEPAAVSPSVRTPDAYVEHEMILHGGRATVRFAYICRRCDPANTCGCDS